ncbi:MAG: CoA-binding protein [Candidatus Marsarchaeota archaeon]|nr:CoA-binding protein [Candidatus Marsarchaeota archaeon]MCL5094504.1 CoA-binding protein [Candidatus Marsarchaeota archaeon]
MFRQKLDKMNNDIHGVDKTALFILKNFHTIAVVGCSREQGKPSHDVPEYLQQNGYRIIPVNPFADYILNEKAYKSLLDIGEQIDVVDVFRPANEAVDIAKQAIQIHAKALWLQEGIINEAAEKLAIENNILFIMNRCMMKEHVKLLE